MFALCPAVASGTGCRDYWMWGGDARNGRNVFGVMPEKGFAKNACLALARSAVCCFSCAQCYTVSAQATENTDLECLLNLDKVLGDTV